MAKISKEDVEKMAQLSRLELSEKEKEKFAGQFSDILDYIKELSEIDDKNIESVDQARLPSPESEANGGQVTGLSNVSREDKITTKCDRDEMLKNAPDQENGFIKVKSILK